MLRTSILKLFHNLVVDGKNDLLKRSVRLAKRVKCLRFLMNNHVREQHGNEPREIAKNFRILRKCSNKFDCLIFKMFFVQDLNSFPKIIKTE